MKTNLIKHILQLKLRQSRALDVLDGAQVLGHALAVLFPHRLHLLLAKLLSHLRIVTQIRLGADDQTGHAGAVVVDLGEPLFSDVLKTGGRGDGKADEEDIGLRIRKRAETVVVFLTCGIEETKCVRLIADPVMTCEPVPSGGTTMSRFAYMTVTA